MVISSIAFKIAFTAFVTMFSALIIDGLNGTSHPAVQSPMWIAVPGFLAAITMVIAFIVGTIALIWGL